MNNLTRETTTTEGIAIYLKDMDNGFYFGGKEAYKLLQLNLSSSATTNDLKILQEIPESLEIASEVENIQVEHVWEQSLANSSDVLEVMIQKAQDNINKGLSKELDWTEL